MRPDDHLPALPDLLGTAAPSVLAPAVAAAGGRLLEARPTQVRYDPGRRLAVRYASTVVWADGTERVETLGALEVRDGLPDGLAVVEAESDGPVGVWRYPHDPFLPGLPHAAYPDGARAVLARLGVRSEAVTVTPVVYRPGSRAVLRLQVRGATCYLKVVPPGAVGSLRRTHEALAEVVRVPRVLGWSEPLGLVVLEEVPGRALTRPLVDGDAPPPPPVDLLALLSRIRDVSVPAAPVDADRTTTAHARLLRRVVPELADDVAALRHAVRGMTGTVDRTVHGDFYQAQVLVDEEGVAGVLDVDDARRGGPHEDPATLVAHLVALAHVHPGAAARIEAYRRDVEALIRRDVDADLFRAGVARVLLGLATTPFRRQQHDWPTRTAEWLRLVEPWTTRDGALSA